MPRHDTTPPRRERRGYDDFGESIATPVPNRTYRSDVDLIADRPTAFEQFIRYVAVILGTLIAVRFVINLFNTGRSRSFINFFYTLTDWVVKPFQAVLGQPPSGTGGYFDWPSLAALIVVGVVASLLIWMLRPSRA
jgi:uncharacterized protein YggT (Ycf19 family)